MALHSRVPARLTARLSTLGRREKKNGGRGERALFMTRGQVISTAAATVTRMQAKPTDWNLPGFFVNAGSECGAKGGRRIGWRLDDRR